MLLSVKFAPPTMSGPPLPLPPDLRASLLLPQAASVRAATASSAVREALRVLMDMVGLSGRAHGRSARSEADGAPSLAGQAGRYHHTLQRGGGQIDEQCQEGDEHGAAGHLGIVELSQPVDEEPAKPAQAHCCGECGGGDDLEG